jgi:hypothetical protein
MTSLFALFFVLPAGLDADDVIDVGDAAHFYGVEVPYEVGIGEDATITVHYRTDVAFEEDVHVFLHIQSQESTCRIVRDERPVPDADGFVAHAFQINIPDSPDCQPQRLEVYTGLYHRGGGGRFLVRGGATTDDRIHAGYFDVVDGETSGTSTIGPSAMKRQKVLSLARPFRYWLMGLSFSTLLSLGLGVWLRRKHATAETVTQTEAEPKTDTKTEETETETETETDSETETTPEAETSSEDDDDPYPEDDDEDAP